MNTDNLIPIAREAAIKALLALEDKAFGHDKGSGEMYAEWCADRGLCQPWDGEVETADEDLPPDFFELLLAVGVSPQEIVNIGWINHKCFPPEMCRAYGFSTPVGRSVEGKDVSG